MTCLVTSVYTVMKSVKPLRSHNYSGIFIHVRFYDITLDIESMYYYSILKYFTFRWLNLWVYQWDNVTVFNALKIYTLMNVCFLLNSMQSFKVDFIDVLSFNIYISLFVYHSQHVPPVPRLWINRFY